MTEAIGLAKGIASAEVAREFFGVQLHFADVLSARAGMPLAEAITFHTNFHRLFAYGNLSKQPVDPEFTRLAQMLAGMTDSVERLNHLILAYAGRSPDSAPSDRFAFGKNFACEAVNADGIVRIHFRNRFNTDAHGPLHASNLPQRRADLTEMFGFVVGRWPEARTVVGQSWLYNTEAYRRLFPPTYGESRKPLEGPRSMQGFSTWGQFIDFRGRAKLAVVETFKHNLETLDVAQPWLSFPYQVLTVAAPIAAFREEYGL